jgi:hypothetical protein
LERWWSTKYKLPCCHSLFQETTFFEHLVDYFLDYYEANPLEQHRNEDGTIQFKATGDDLIDRWEKELSQGNTPDLMEAFSEEQKNSIIKRLERVKNNPQAEYLRTMYPR